MLKFVNYFLKHYEWIFSSRYVCYCVIISFYNSMLQARFLVYETKREIRLRQSKMEFKLSVRNFNDSTCATSNEIAVHDAMVTFDFSMTICRCNDVTIDLRNHRCYFICVNLYIFIFLYYKNVYKKSPPVLLHLFYH